MRKATELAHLITIALLGVSIGITLARIMRDYVRELASEPPAKVSELHRRVR